MYPNGPILGAISYSVSKTYLVLLAESSYDQFHSVQRQDRQRPF
jgi:hypothetical protein